jgi:type II secretory pathway pseudopilin PulG
MMDCIYKNENIKDAANYARGITLIETVLYIALLATLLALVLPLFLDLRSWQSKQERFADTATEYLFIQAKIKNLIQENGVRIISPAIGGHGSHLVLDSENEGRITFDFCEADESNRQKLCMDFQRRRNLPGNPYSLLSSSSVIDRINFYHSRSEAAGVEGIETLQFSLSINGFDFGTTTAVISNN